jgi:hypothetical protein
MLSGRKLAWDRAEKLAIGIGLMTLGGAGALALVIASAQPPKQDLWGEVWFLMLFSFLLLMTLAGVVLLGVVLTTHRQSAPIATVVLPWPQTQTQTRTSVSLAEPDLAPPPLRSLNRCVRGLPRALSRATPAM